MKKFLKWTIIIAAVLAVLLFSGYFALMQYYREHIPWGTWVNGIYCTGMTVEELSEALLCQDENSLYTEAVDMEGEVHSFAPPREAFFITYEEGLAELVSYKNIRSVFKEKIFKQPAKITLYEDVWKAYLYSTPLFNTEKKLPANRFTIIQTEDGYELKEKNIHVFDKAKAEQLITGAILAGTESVDLVDAGCYTTPPYNGEEEARLEKYKALQAEYETVKYFCNRMSADIIIGEEIAYQIDAEFLKNWILKDKKGEYIYDKGGALMLDEEKLVAFAEEVAQKETTYWGAPWDFTTHDGRQIQVKAGNFGRKMDSEPLKEALLKAYKKGGHHVIRPEFTFYPKSAKDVEYGAGVGDSYIELDIKAQKVFMYIDGECILESDVVTGDISRGWHTPRGVFYIEYKQRNRTLRGATYTTPVNYWMHFYSHCGFHDATWRKAFGGDIYLKDGSHGCVNMTLTDVKALYGKAYAGMPVVVYDN